MLSDFEKVSRLSLHIRSLLATSHYLQIQDVIRSIAANPILRNEQLSLAFMRLNKDWKWDLVEEFGPVSFVKFDGITDLQVCAIRESTEELPLSFFSWPSEEFDSSESPTSVELFALPLGTRDYDDGLILCHSVNGYPTQERPEPYSFLRLAAEFIYRHHKMIEGKSAIQGVPDQTLDSQSVEPPANPLDGVTLTNRQMQILGHISDGLTNEEIAKTMHVSLGTVRVETSRIYDRLGARNRHQAASLAHLLVAN